MNEDLRDDEEDVTPIPLTLGQRAMIGASSALITAGLPAILHAPLPIEVGGLIGAVVLAVNSPKWGAQLREEMPWLDSWLERREQERAAGSRPPHEWSFIDRFIFG